MKHLSLFVSAVALNLALAVVACGEPCGQAPSVQNATIATISVPNSDKSHFSQYAVYTCNANEGYVMEGNSTISCVDGVWSPVEASCKKIVCTTSPPVMVGGSHNFNQKFFDPNCIEYGQGSFRNPINRSGCTPIRPIPFVTQYVTFKCNQGYRFKNVSAEVSSTCLPTGVWSTPADTCQPIDCGQMADRQGYECNMTSTVYPSQATCNCLFGYHRNGYQPTFIRTCQVDGSWSNPTDRVPANCARVSCPSPPDVINGILLKTEGTQFGDIAIYECDPGYRFENDTPVTCTGIRAWLPSPWCSLRDCGSPPVVIDGRSTYGRTFFRSVANYTCDVGYRLIGSSQITCTEKGVWSQAPYCNKMRCGEPPAVSHSRRYVKGYYFTDTTTYRCDPGYELRGNTNSTCLLDGFWSSPPDCAKVICGDVPVVDNAGIVSLGDQMFGSAVQYNCYPGYQMQGIQIVSCLASGLWTQAPNCTEVSSVVRTSNQK